MQIANNVRELVGKTPLIRINSFSKEAKIIAKVEFLNPGHSIKDRIALNMINEAFKKGAINENSVIIEPTSGNTGVGLAMIAASYGLRAIFTMPSSMSLERQKLLLAYGAELVLTEPKLGMKGAVDKANELAKEIKNSFIPSQFDNPDNPKAHENTTAKEILEQSDGKIDIIIAGFGTGGTISGTARVLKKHIKNLKVIAVEPQASPLLSQGYAAAHAIQGIGANFVPQNLDKSVIDEFFTVSNENAIATTQKLARQEGLLAGISSGANIFAASEFAKLSQNANKTILTFLNDTGERYISTGIFG